MFIEFKTKEGHKKFINLSFIISISREKGEGHEDHDCPKGPAKIKQYGDLCVEVVDAELLFEKAISVMDEHDSTPHHPIIGQINNIN
jgi:hypothetical protein